MRRIETPRNAIIEEVVDFDGAPNFFLLGENSVKIGLLKPCLGASGFAPAAKSLDMIR